MTDKEFLLWVFERISNIYGENECTDWMLRLKAIAEDYPAYKHTKIK